MTSFTPNSIFSANISKIDLNEILIPYRFISVMNYFILNKCTIKDVGNKDSSMSEKLDVICRSMGWQKYSSLLKELRSLYENRHLENDYLNQLGKDIVDMKLKKIFPEDFEDLTISKNKMPAFILFKDKVSSPYHDTSDLENLVENTFDSILSDILCREIFYGSNFDLSESLIKNLQEYNGNINITIINTLINRLK